MQYAHSAQYDHVYFVFVVIITGKVHDTIKMNRDDRLCWYHKSLARDEAEDLLKNGK